MKYKKLYPEILELDYTYILIGYWNNLYGYYVKYDDSDKYIWSIARLKNSKVNTGVKFNLESINNFTHLLKGKLI